MLTKEHRYPLLKAQKILLKIETGVPGTIFFHYFKKNKKMLTLDRKNKLPRKSKKFGALSLYYNGVYYFPSDIKESDKREGRPFEIQGVYYQGKWYQDTFYITKEFKDFLLNSL